MPDFGFSEKLAVPTRLMNGWIDRVIVKVVVE